MSTLLEIEKAIENLPRTEFRELHRWMSDRDFAAWDDEIAADAAAGKFEDLRRRVLADYGANRCSDL